MAMGGQSKTKVWRLLLEQKKPHVVRSAGTTTTTAGQASCRQAVVRLNAGRGLVRRGGGVGGAGGGGGARAVVGGAGGG